MKHWVWLLAFTISTSGFAASLSMAGKWDLSTNVAGEDSTTVCTFAQKDLALTGTCTGDDGAHPLTGKIDGSKVTWQYKTEYSGEPLTIIFSGMGSSKDAFAGSVDVEPMTIEGSFSATRANQ